MSRQGTIKSYRVLIELLQSPLKPNRNQMLDRLQSEGFEISNRTLDRYISELRNEFQIEISYDRFSNCYFIHDESTEDVNSFLRYASMMHAGETLGALANRRNMKFISSEKENTFKGIEHMHILLEAMQKRKWINLTYRKFGSNESKAYEVQPYLLKEYQSRWYIFTRLGDNKPYRTFGLDRIEQVVMTKKSFRMNDDVDPVAYFENSIGLTYDNNNKLQEVHIAVKKGQAEYIRSLPWHHSQKVLKDNEDAVTFGFTVIPNFELIQKILTQGDSIEVLKPKSLRTEICKIARHLVKNNS